MSEDGKYVGRLAPSPTGLLHLGHARTFLIAHERARVAGGELWLRDEDLDGQRSKAEFAAAYREDLRWLGCGWDREMLQSERIGAYRAAMEELLRLGAVYPCHCSRRDLLQAVAAPHEDADDEPVYTGRCRPVEGEPGAREMRPVGGLGAVRGEASSARLVEGTNYRFRVPDGEAVGFVDGGAGAQSFVAGSAAGADFGDFVVWRKEGLPSYQLACVVDDAATGVTEVVRGRDLLKSTARQILLYRALGLRAPAWFHTELLRDEAGVRLAKRHDSLSLRALREAGVTAAEVRRRLGF